MQNKATLYQFCNSYLRSDMLVGLVGSLHIECFQYDVEFIVGDTKMMNTLLIIIG